MSLGFSNNDLENKKIIIVEDDLPSVKYYQTVLQNSGAVVQVFSNGRQFTEFISKSSSSIDLVIIDFLIPFVNGIDCVKAFRKENKCTPVLMITAYFSDQTRKEALIAGCNEYVLKPVFPDKLHALLEKYLKPAVSYSEYSY